MFNHYEMFNLIKDKYFIEYIYKRDDSCYAQIYYIESLAPKTCTVIGNVVTYFESQPISEDERPNWRADCHLDPKCMKKELIDSIGKELLERTSCKEPFVLNVYKGDVANGDFRVYGDLYREE